MNCNSAALCNRGASCSSRDGHAPVDCAGALTADRTFILSPVRHHRPFTPPRPLATTRASQHRQRISDTPPPAPDETGCLRTSAGRHRNTVATSYIGTESSLVSKILCHSFSPPSTLPRGARDTLGVMCSPGVAVFVTGAGSDVMMLHNPRRSTIQEEEVIAGATVSVSPATRPSGAQQLLERVAMATGNQQKEMLDVI